MKKNKNIKNQKSIWKNSGFYFISLLTILSIGLIVQLFIINILPVKYSVIIAIILIVLWLLMYVLQFSKKINKSNRVLGKILISILCVALIAGNFYVFKGGETLRNISGTNVKTNAISVVVLKENVAAEKKDISLLKDSTFAIMSKTDRENTNLTLDNIKSKVGTSVKTSEYEAINDVAQALYDKKADAILLNEAYRGMMEEKFPNFDSETTVVYQYEIETKIEDISKNVNVTKEPFNVYISGIDSYGSVSVISRTDVNMIVSVNPATHQILLTSIPRDYYVPQTCQANQKDKLTHTGIYGVDCSVSTLENFFGININYYARVNFSSLIHIVDALGGVTVNNPNGFVDDLGNSFGQGDINLNGERALAFSRDRHNQAGGDRGRGQNQMHVITGIINKAISPTIITNYNSVMNAVSGSFETNMESGDITKFVQKQLDTMAGWNIVQYSVDGTGSDNTWSPANGFNSYVMIPDMNTVNEAKRLMGLVSSGQTIAQ